MLCEYPAFPTIPASDMARARRFYEETLGLDAERVDPDGIVYRASSSVVFLYPSAYAGTNKATAASFVVTDLPATVAELKAHGVRFEEYDLPDVKTDNGMLRTPTGRAAWFKDSKATS